MKSLGSGGGGGATEENEGWGAEVSSGRSAGAGSWLAFLSALPVPPPFDVTTAVVTIAPIATVARAPPPIISSLLRRARAAD
ncbi:hypothetical protein SBADM41S_10719 [Streptomyces badius]